MSDTWRVLVTGDREDLDQRCPHESKKNGVALEWVSLPVLEFQRLDLNPTQLQDLVDNPRDWILFTSARAVRFWNEGLLDAGLDFPIETQVACIGRRTADAANHDGFTPDFYPTEPGTEGFLAEFEALVTTGSAKPTLVIPMAKDGRMTIAERLTELGCQVQTLALYQTKPCKNLSTLFHQKDVEGCAAIVFTSPSSIDAFRSVFRIPSTTKVAALGSFTSKHLTELGLVHKTLPHGDFQRIEDVL